MTFATEQNHVSNVGLALEIDWQKRIGIIAQRGLPPLPPLPQRAKAETRERNSAGGQASACPAPEAGNYGLSAMR